MRKAGQIRKRKNRQKDEVFGAEALLPIVAKKLKAGPKPRGRRGIIALHRTEYYKERMRYILGEEEG